MGWIVEGLLGVILYACSGIFRYLIDLTKGLAINLGQKDSELFFLFGKAPDSYTNLFLLMGFVLVISIVLYKLFQTMLGPISDGEDPGPLAARCILALIGVFFSYRIFLAMESFGNLIFKTFQNQQEANFNNYNMIFDPEKIEALKGASDLSSGNVIGDAVAYFPLSEVFCLILCVLVLFEFIKLVIEIFERYVTLGLLYYTSPLAFSMLASKGTKNIFGSWLQMVISQMILMCMNLFFVSIFMSGMQTMYSKFFVESPVDTITIQHYTALMFLLVAWLILGQKVDEHLRSLGLSVAQTGGSIAGIIMSDIHMATAAAGTIHTVKSAGKAIGAGSNALTRQTFDPAAKTMRDVADKAQMGALNATSAADVKNANAFATGSGKAFGADTNSWKSLGKAGQTVSQEKSKQAANIADCLTKGAMSKAFPTGQYSYSGNGQGKITMTDKDGNAFSMYSSKKHKMDPGSQPIGNNGWFMQNSSPEASQKIAEANAKLLGGEKSSAATYNGVSGINATEDGKGVFLSSSGLNNDNAQKIAETYGGKYDHDSGYIHFDNPNPDITVSHANEASEAIKNMRVDVSQYNEPAFIRGSENAVNPRPPRKKSA